MQEQHILQNEVQVVDPSKALKNSLAYRLYHIDKYDWARQIAIRKKD
jgi:hypothetical protein